MCVYIWIIIGLVSSIALVLLIVTLRRISRNLAMIRSGSVSPENSRPAENEDREDR